MSELVLQGEEKLSACGRWQQKKSKNQSAKLKIVDILRFGENS
jgi:hypothetical protein